MNAKMVKQNESIIRLVPAVKTILIFLVSFSPNVFSQLAAGYDKFLGNASDPPFPATYDTYWNQLTPGNAGKWGTVEGTRDQYSWTQLDQDYNYAIERGFAFKHHILVQGSQQPSWMTALDSAEQAEEIEEWFRLVGERYPDLTFADVVGEVISNKAPYRNALGGDGVTGWDWVIKAFKLAKQYLPAKTKKILLEVNIINGGPNVSQFIQIVNLLKDSSLIDGIGLVSHNLENVDTTTIRNSLDQLWATGVDIYVHSLDIGSADDDQQLTLYKERFPILWEHPGVKGITLWGYIQGQIYQPNGYLLRTNGTERPALSWLRDYLTPPGSYRSFQSGNWNDVNTWEQYNGTAWAHPASASPSSAQAPVTILDGHTITVTANDSGSNILIASGGTLVINAGVNFTIKNSAVIDINVKGTIANSGTLLKDDAAEIIFVGGGKYSHLQDGGSLPRALWRGGSIALFEGVTSTAPSNANQNFFNVVWNCPGQTANLTLGWNGNTIGGDITITNTGSAMLYMCEPQTDSSAIVNVEGDIIQTGGELSTNGTTNGNTSITINHTGSINVTGGNFSISRGSQGGTGTTMWNLGGNFSMSNATTQNSNAGGATIVFTGTETHNLVLGSGNTLTALPIEVDSSASLNMGTSELQGAGIFVLRAGATLYSGHPGGINGNLKNTGTITLSDQAGYGFNGTAAQVTGNLLPDQVENLILNNSAGITLSKSVTVNGTVDVKKTGFSTGTFQLHYGSEATLSYSGTTAMSTSDVEFPAQSGPHNVTIDNSSSTGITLHASRTIAGNLLLSGKFRLANNNFTAASAERVGLTDFAVTDGTGSLILVNVGTTAKLFPVGTTSYAPVWIANSGTEDNVGVRVESDASTLPGGGRVKAKWALNEALAGGGNYTLTFGWAGQLEDTPFKQNRAANAGIFLLSSDTVEAGTGGYTTQFTASPYTVSRGGISVLGTFGVGKFGDFTVDVKDEKVLPAEFSLSQNYPNPFNPATNISFFIPKDAHVSLKVFDILGKEITTIVNQNLKRGEHKYTWDAADAGSGMYFYRLTAGEYIQTRKMLLMK